MSFIPSLPVSYLIRADSIDESNSRKTREEWKKLKELEEARKLGNIPAQVDEEGKDINPHIPQYISQAPWYFNSVTPTLKHQREQTEHLKTFHKLDKWYERGLVAERPKKFRKGACENCGSITHKRKDCVERPRKIGAKYSHADMAPDEIIIAPGLETDFDGKRDRWNGYDPAEYIKVIQDHAKIEEAKKILKSQKLEKELEQRKLANEEKNADNQIPLDNDSKNKSESTTTVVMNDVPLITDDLKEDSEDDDKYAEGLDMPGTKLDSKERVTVRNLRIREDTAKYLFNLDPDSAFYDPKTRSMRANPFEETGLSSNELQYAGDNFVRYTGDIQSLAKQQMFAWEALEKGIDVNQQSEPTKLELLYKEFKTKQNELQNDLANSLYDRYGHQEQFKPPPAQLLLNQSETYTEYSRTGQIIKGQEKPKIRSKYEEDIYPQNHTSVWGSFWYKHLWGYQCCCSFVKQSYCTGERGKLLFLERLETEEMEKTSKVSLEDNGNNHNNNPSKRIRIINE